MFEGSGLFTAGVCLVLFIENVFFIFISFPQFIYDLFHLSLTKNVFSVVIYIDGFHSDVIKL